ncbi:TonB-dependent receptor [Shewanella sp. 202IG2-18]|uniref:TonB-dependent receptor n=1 Tax=Parashewanella hymeniacidonis TaxID=2807618 RepID=UPI00195F90EF|nr:TonB-dependent receptor [Parashewanella hymeniacidonis]MBM7072727.1 TonB-dependent receptor [Parashewanella hymeniacidonis]
MKKPFKLSAICLALCSIGISAQAIAVGKFEGSVRAEQSKQPLSGAIVTIQELNQSQTAGRDGRFFFNGLKAGNYTVSISYLGVPTQTRKITVTDNQTSDLIVELAGNEIERITVTGHTGSLSKSLNRQRSADNLVSVISADVLGNFPDSNVSEALQRVPGVSIERDQGEGRFVRIRGLAPDYNSVSMNGTRLPAPEDDRRAVALDVIPSDLVQSVEVSKTITPDMDADSLGGAVEVKSLSAFDRDELFFNLSGEASYNGLTEQTSPKFAASYSDTFNEKFGVAVAASWYNRKFGSENVEVDGGWDLDDEKLEEVEARNYDINRERIGLGINLDYRPTEDHDLFLRSLYSKYDDDEVRNASGVEWEDATDTQTLSPAEVKRSLKARTEEQDITSFVLGGQSRLTKWTVDYQASYSRATAAKPLHIGGAEFEAEFDKLGFQGTQKPIILANEDYYDASEYELKEIEIADTRSTDTVKGGKIDFTRSFELGKNGAEIKFGAKASTREKTNREDVWIFEDFEDFGVSEDLLSLGAYSNSTVTYGLSEFGPSISTDSIWGLVNAMNASEFADDIESKIGDFDINEDLTAAYIMGTVDFDQLKVIAGVRYENVDWDSQGYRFNEDEEFIASNSKRSEDHLLPSIHVRYEFNENTIFRASWTNTITRPTFDQIAPGFLLEIDKDEDNETGEVEIIREAEFGNPDLKSLESMNVDISLEHYFDGVGLLSVGGFYKDIENFIYEADLAGRSEYVNYKKALTFVNGNNADLYGFELAYVQEFNFLSEPFNDLLINTNITYTDSNAEIQWFDDDELLARYIPLPSQSDLSANFSIGYENAYTSVWLSAAYKSEYLQEVTEINDEKYDMYEDDHLQWDFVAKAHITEAMTVYFKAINITDEPFYSYAGSRRFNNQYEEYGRTFQLGIQVVNF